MKKEKLLRLGPYGIWLQYRWNLKTARSAGSLRNVFASDWKKGKARPAEILRAHHFGWGVDDWRMCGGGLTPETCGGYLSTVEYRRLHPLNGTYSSWVDDKLTLKYLCGGSLSNLMPEYYFQILDGSVLALPDCPGGLSGSGVCGVSELLRDRDTLAFKLVRGSLGEGFYKAKNVGEAVMVNGRSMSWVEFEAWVLTLEGYIVTEYLRPHPDMHAFSSSTANAVRYLVANEKGSPRFLHSFVRFGTSASGFVENYNAGGGAVLCLGRRLLRSRQCDERRVGTQCSH